MQEYWKTQLEQATPATVITDFGYTILGLRRRGAVRGQYVAVLDGSGYPSAAQAYLDEKYGAGACVITGQQYLVYNEQEGFFAFKAYGHSNLLALPFVLLADKPEYADFA